MTDNPFIWEGDTEVEIVPPVDAVQTEIDRIDAVLLAAGGDTFADAAPEPLYVSRRVLNATEIRQWARAAGITSLVVADELHATICYSTRPLDWMAVGQPWEEEIDIPAGGPRVLELFGDGGAVVLRFASSALQWRHKEFKEAGASWDHAEYAPHITLSYSGVIPEGATAYQGRIKLGPEIFEEIKA